MMEESMMNSSPGLEGTGLSSRLLAANCWKTVGGWGEGLWVSMTRIVLFQGTTSQFSTREDTHPGLHLVGGQALLHDV